MGDVVGIEGSVRVVEQAGTLFLWAVTILLGVVAWRRRRDDSVSDYLFLGGFVLLTRIILWGSDGLPLARLSNGWLVFACDVAGLLVLIWPFLSPPFSVDTTDRIAGGLLLVILLAFGGALWQAVRRVLGMPSVPLTPEVGWPMILLSVAGLSLLQLRVRGRRSISWLLTSLVTIVIGGGGVLLVADGMVSPLMMAAMSTLGGGWLNLLDVWADGSPYPRRRRPSGERPHAVPMEPPKVARDRLVAARPWWPSRWLEASTEIFEATDFSRLLEVAYGILDHVLGDVSFVGLALVTEKQGDGAAEGSSLLRLAARVPARSDDRPDPLFSSDLSPLLRRPLLTGDRAEASRSVDGSSMRPLDRILTTHPEAMLVYPLEASKGVSGLLLVGRDSVELDEVERKLSDALVEQIALAIEHLRLRERGAAEIRSLSTLVEHHEFSTGRLLGIIETIADGVLVADADDRIILANSAALRLLDREREQTLGFPLGSVVDLTFGLSDADIFRRLTEQSPYNMDVMCEVAERSLRVSMAPIESHEGGQQGVVALLQDVTPLLQAESQRNEVLGQLRWENERLDHAVEQLRALIRPGRPLALSRVDLTYLIEDALETVAASLTDRPISMMRALEYDLPIVRADTAQLRQTLLTLLNLMVQDIGAGEIAVSASHGKGYAVVSISKSTGEISPAYVQAVRASFVEGAEPVNAETWEVLKRDLSTCRRVIERHGGKTWVRNGDVLTLYLGIPVDGPPSD